MKKIWVPLLGLALLGCGNKTETVMTDAEGNRVTTDSRGNVIKTDEDRGNGNSEPGAGKTPAKSEKGKPRSVTPEEGLTSTGADGTKYATGGAAKISESDFGLPFYPGSEEDFSGSRRIDKDDQHVVTSLRTTKDDMSKVVAFYKPKLKEITETNANTPQSKITTLEGKLDDGSKVQMVITWASVEKKTSINIYKTKKK